MANPDHLAILGACTDINPATESNRFLPAVRGFAKALSRLVLRVALNGEADRRALDRSQP